VLNSGRAAFRNIAVNALRDVIAKHDLDPRYTDLVCIEQFVHK